jgi:hypothetical protein
MGIGGWIAKKFVGWLNHEAEPSDVPPCDFERLCFEIRPCDVLLVEGRTRIGSIIKTITSSPWTHVAIYVGRMRDIEDPDLQGLIQRYYQGDPNEQLVIEALLGEGTVVKPLSKYSTDHLRICRPRGLSDEDAKRVVAEAVRHLGVEYDLRQLIDLARLMIPFAIVPRRWRSTLFEYAAGEQTKIVCSTMIAEVFHAVQYPILPVIHRMPDGQLKLFKRNTRLYVARDFDYSPYFEIVKYPLLGADDLAFYRRLPWDQDGVVCNGHGECYLPESKLTGVENQVNVTGK